MTLYPNCKINLGLRIVRKREDGYHDLETIFYPIYDLHDELEIEPSSTFSFSATGLALDCASEDNLIIRCYQSMAKRYPQIGNVAIRFKKNIPFGAGLGGGSSDAAHTAIALNELFELGLTKVQLAEEVRPLGADCPFFIYNTPCFAEGIGDLLTPIDLSLNGLRLVMIKPSVYVSTREAYSGIQSNPSPLTLSSSRPLTLSSIKHFTNDFEGTVFRQYPILAQIKKHLQDIGAIYAAMSGSGSTLYALFEDNAERRADAQFGRLNEEFASMVIFNDTLR